MQPTPSTAPPYDAPASAEEAVLMVLARLGRRMRQRLPGEDLDFAAVVLLKALVGHGPARLTDLAGVLHLDVSTVSRQVKSLEDRGLVERHPDPEDKRASLIAATADGADRLETGARRRRALIADLLAGWPETDRDQLHTLLTRLLTELDHDPENR